MSKYASLLFSPTEYHEIAPFRFPIYRDLVPGEAKGIEGDDAGTIEEHV